MKKRNNLSDITAYETLSILGHPFLAFGVGANFSGEAPPLSGMWKFEESRKPQRLDPEKKDKRKYEKAYFTTLPEPLLETRESARVAIYPVSEAALKAVSWEVMLNRRALRSSEGDRFFVAFGRHREAKGEPKPFTFNKEENGLGRKHFLRLVLARDPRPPYETFIPLYVKLFMTGLNHPVYYCLNVDWLRGEPEEIHVSAFEVPEGEAPEHLVCLTREQANELG